MFIETHHILANYMHLVLYVQRMTFYLVSHMSMRSST